jgi:D-amino-acid dehydrogenase
LAAPRLCKRGGDRFCFSTPPARRHRGLFYAFGHGHLGLTQAAATGRLVAEMACGEPASIDLTPFAADRF